MKTSIKKVNNQYRLVIIDDNNQVVNDSVIEGRDPKDPSILKLPENPSNRKWLSMKKVDMSLNQELVLDYKETRTLNTHHTTGVVKSSKNDIEYLTDEEKVIYQDLMNKIQARKERKKLEDQIAQLKAQLEGLN